MKKFFLTVALCVFAALPLTAQTTSDIFQLGSKAIRVPAPEGFVDTATRFDKVALRLATTEAPQNETIASYVPESLVSKLTENQNIDLPIYAKFSVGRRIKDLDCSPQNFATTVAGFKAFFPTLLDPNSQATKQLESDISGELKELSGKDQTVRLSGQKNLGYFQETPDVFSGLSAVNLEVNGKSMPLIGSASLVRVNDRLIFLYVYKQTTSKDDVALMMDLAKKWTASVLFANAKTSARESQNRQ
jgi:hypothetical protein